MAIIGIGHGVWTPPGAQIVAGIDYPGSATEAFDPEPTLTTMLVWNESVSGTTVPAMSGGVTFIWWCRPTAAQAGYWSGLFHCMYNTNWGQGGATDVSLKRYMGMHPYPTTGATVNRWSISANGADTQTYSGGTNATISQWDRKYVQVGFCTPNGGSVDYTYYPDYISSASPGSYLEHVGDSKADPAAADRSIIQGDARWNMGNERFNGPLSMPDVYAGTVLTLAEVDLALADPFDSAVSSRLWYTNRYPTSNTDISDKSGNGNDPAWVIGASYNGGNPPPLYQEE